MRREDAFWAAMVAAGVGYEAFVLRSERLEHTASRTTRRWWHTDTKGGRLAFTLAWGAFAGWYAHHILEGSR